MHNVVELAEKIKDYVDAPISAIVNEYGSKNLNSYPYANTTRTTNGITFTDNGDGTITANGTATADAYFNVHARTPSAYDLILPNGKYNFSGCPAGGSDTPAGYAIRLERTYNNTAANLGRDTGSGATITLNGDDYFDDRVRLQINIVIRSGGTVSDLVFKPMLCLASIKDTSWAPYVMTNLQITDIIGNNAGFHNSIFRGKKLGTELTDYQSSVIKAGTFTDLFIGDYWTINGVNWRIADFDYFYRSGDTECKTHHAVIVPDTNLYTAQMHNTESGAYDAEDNTTEGGYTGSDMYLTNLDQAKTIITEAFGSAHILSHRLWLTNKVTDGRVSGGAWTDSTVDLMTEQMVYGSGIFNPVSDGTTVPANYRVGNAQLALFKLDHSKICIRSSWWLRDVISSMDFAYVRFNGNASYSRSSYVLGVRPAFCIY